MLHPSIFDSQHMLFRNRVLCVVCSVYYTLSHNCRKVYTPIKKIKISSEVPSYLIFSKTVSSLFDFKNINSYLKWRGVKFCVFYPVFHFFSKNGKNTLHTTHYTLHTILDNSVTWGEN